MSDKMIIALILSFSTLGAVVSSSPLKERWSNGNTDISVIISEKEMRLTASYPKEKSRRVHEYVKETLHLNGLPDMQAVEIKEYKTPDGLYSMYIKSRDGYLKIRMDRLKNPPGTFDQLKLVSEGIQKVLADN
jgi:hypothetical protein